MFKNWFQKEPKETEIKEEQRQETASREPVLDAPKLGFFDKLKQSLTKTRARLTDQIDEILKGYAKIDEELFEDLEDVLVSADIGMQTTMQVMDRLRNDVRTGGVTDPQEVKALLRSQLIEAVRPVAGRQSLATERPMILLVIGVNGVGKTTSIGKLAARLKKSGDSVLLTAADTFRAAAIDQLLVWAERAGVECVHQQEGADPASVVYDGIARVRALQTDVLICDTAGRLHNKSNLMQELNKIHRVIDREYPQATRETLLVLDATTGQNALEQAKQFREVAEPTGIILTKLDGTAKGGVVFPLMMEYGIPVKYVGLGEGVDDLEPFDAEMFVDAIFS